MKKILPDKRKATLVYTSTKHGSNFNIKDITTKEHMHDLVYGVKYPEETCDKTYNGETGGRLVERIDERRGKDKNSHVYQHSVNSNLTLVTLDDLTILKAGYKHNKFKRSLYPFSFLSFFFCLLLLILTFQNPIIFAVEFCFAVNNVEFRLEYFKYFTLIHSQILFARSQFYFDFMVSNPLFSVFIS